MQTWRKLDTSLGTALDDSAKFMFIIFSVVGLLLCLGYQFLAIPHRYSLDYGEAPLVDQAMRLASGQNIYYADLSEPPYTISNYPPLYVTVLAGGVKLFGPARTFQVGRVISALSAWIASICLAFIIYTVTRNRFAAAGAALTFIAFPFVLYWSPLLRIDMLALALSLSALCVLVSEPFSARRLVLSAVLLVAAIYTRQSYALAAPLAAFVWLMARHWRQALRLTALVGGLSLALFFILNGLTRGGFYFNIVTANVNEFTLDQLRFNWELFREAALFPLVIGVFSLFLVPRWSPLWTLAAPYLVGSALSALTIGKVGSNVNYLLELCAALGLAAGVLIAWSRVYIPLYSVRAALLILMSFGVLKMINTTVKDYTWDLRERRAASTDLSQLESLVAEVPGLILADEYMGMLTLQGRPLLIQPFEVTQLSWAGKWDQTPLLNSIKDKEFAAIIIYDRPWADERWTQEMFDAINRSYRLTDILAENKIYTAVPRKASDRLSACAGAVWQLPSGGRLGIQWQDGGLDFFGHGNEGKIPVYAVASGLLTRWPNWVDAVAILHDDPLHPGSKLWSYYGNMRAANGTDSYVAQDFPLGASGIPVKAGQLLGYQGSWSGKPLWPTWTHIHFNIIRAAKPEAFPSEWTFGETLDPSPYLGLIFESGNENLQPLKCEKP
jgi:hypothetical protein